MFYDINPRIVRHVKSTPDKLIKSNPIQISTARCCTSNNSNNSHLAIYIALLVISASFLQFLKFGNNLNLCLS